MNTHYLTKTSMVGLMLSLPIFASFANAQTFSYDAAGRVMQVNFANSTIVKYKYDAAGNVKKIRSNSDATASITAEESNNDVVSLKVQRTGNLSQALTVGLLAGGNALSGQDYSSLPASVTLPAHQSSVSFSVTLRDDRSAVSDKKLVVNLAESDDYDLDKNSSVTVTIPAKK